MGDRDEPPPYSWRPTDAELHQIKDMVILWDAVVVNKGDEKVQVRLFKELEAVPHTPALTDIYRSIVDRSTVAIRSGDTKAAEKT